MEPCCTSFLHATLLYQRLPPLARRQSNDRHTVVAVHRAHRAHRRQSVLFYVQSIDVSFLVPTKQGRHQTRHTDHGKSSGCPFQRKRTFDTHHFGSLCQTLRPERDYATNAWLFIAVSSSLAQPFHLSNATIGIAVVWSMPNKHTKCRCGRSAACTTHTTHTTHTTRPDTLVQRHCKSRTGTTTYQQ